MIITSLPVGQLQTNCYMIAADKTTPAVLIDPGAEGEKLLSVLNGRHVAAILLTHGHFDHIGALASFPGVPVYIHPQDTEMLSDPALNGSMDLGFFEKQVCCPLPVEEGQLLSLAGMDITVWHTPGHSRGSVCYLAKDVVFTGDTLFHRGYGRTDLYGGSFSDLRNSLRRLFTLDESITFYPGHGQSAQLFMEQ